MRIIRDEDGQELERTYDEFEVFKTGRGSGYSLSTIVGGEWSELFIHGDAEGLRAIANVLNMKWIKAVGV